VTDPRGMQGSTLFAFSAKPWQAVHVELTWDKDDTDVDVHLVEATEAGQLFQSPWDCYFDDTDPDWGAPGTTVDNPSIDLDNTTGFGPEHVDLAQPLAGHRYEIYAHYYDDRGHGSTNATIRIYLSGMLRY